MQDAIDHGFPEEDCLTYEKLKKMDTHIKQIPLAKGQENPMEIWERNSRS